MHRPILGSAAVLLVAAFATWSALVHTRQLIGFDATAMAATKLVIAPWLDVAAGLLNYAAPAELTLVGTAALSLWLWRRGIQLPNAAAPLIWLPGLMIELTMKFTLYQPGPSADLYRKTLSYGFLQMSTMQSYPSGHSLRIAFLAVLVPVLLAWLIARHTPARAWVRWLLPLVGPVLLALLLSAGWTRSYQGHHWPSDVIGGWLLGFGCACAALWLLAPYSSAPRLRSRCASTSSGTR